MRLYRSNKFFEKLLNMGGISKQTKRIIKSLGTMIFILHLIGCLWATVASLTDNELNWYNVAHVRDEGSVAKYIASVYWATVTINTIGYGDIVPLNETERLASVLLLPVGVFLYTFTVSELSNLFSSVNAQVNIMRDKEKIIKDLAQKNHFSEDLTKRIQFFFQE